MIFSCFTGRVGVPLLTVFLLTFGHVGFSELQAADVATDPIGFVRVDCPGRSDTITSVPLSRPAVFRANGTVSTLVTRPAASGKNTRTTVVTDAASVTSVVFAESAFSVDQFKYVAGTQPDTYCVRFNNGSREGSFYTITNNDASSLTLDLNGDDLSALTGTVNVSIVPYWTLATLFPGGQGITAANSTKPGTHILLPDTKSVGTNLAAVGEYFYLSRSASWFGVGRSGGSGGRTVANDTVLYPDTPFTVRNNGAAATSFVVGGAVVTTKLTIPLAASAAGEQDNVVALMRPVPVTLNDSGLISSGAFAASSGPGTGDQLLVFDNAAVMLNKPPAAAYTFTGGMWQKSDGSADAGGDAVFSPGTGVIIRKAATANGATVLWINSPTY